MIIFSSFLIWKNILKLKKNEHIIFIFYWNKKTGGKKRKLEKGKENVLCYWKEGFFSSLIVILLISWADSNSLTLASTSSSFSSWTILASHSLHNLNKIQEI